MVFEAPLGVVDATTAWQMTDTTETKLAQAFPILFGKQWRARGLAGMITMIDTDALAAEYDALHELAPRRSGANKPYFIGHTGIPSSKGHSTRLEEHCAIALVNLQRRWPRRDGGWFRMLDYQVPLKGRQGDGDVGKIDILGVTDLGRKRPA